MSGVAIAALDDLDPEEIALFRWRFDCFSELGYETTRAIELALRDVDHHAVEGLLARGCERELAVEILT